MALMKLWRGREGHDPEWSGNNGSASFSEEKPSTLVLHPLKPLLVKLGALGPGALRKVE